MQADHRSELILKSKAKRELNPTEKALVQYLIYKYGQDTVESELYSVRFDVEYPVHYLRKILENKEFYEKNWTELERIIDNIVTESRNKNMGCGL